MNVDIVNPMPSHAIPHHDQNSAKRLVAGKCPNPSIPHTSQPIHWRDVMIGVSRSAVWDAGGGAGGRIDHTNHPFIISVSSSRSSSILAGSDGVWRVGPMTSTTTSVVVSISL